jgi:hypothetical protein
MSQELEIRRIVLAASWTMGVFLWDKGKQPELFVLEDTVREIPGHPVSEWKLPKTTAIPVGRYKLIMDMSSRFNREMPHILDVPGFDGVRIHGGVTAADTEGCPMLGFGANLMTGTLQQGLTAAYQFYDKLQEILKVDECWITIK